MTEPKAATPTGLNPDYNPEAVIARLREELAGLKREMDEAHQVIDESHRMIVDEDTGRRWKELFREAEEQIAKLQKLRQVGAEAVRELFGIADIINSYAEAPHSDGHDGALGRRIKGYIEQLRQQIADLKRCPCCGETRLHVVCGCDSVEAKLAEAERAIAEMRGERACSCETLVMAESQLIEMQARVDKVLEELGIIKAERERLYNVSRAKIKNLATERDKAIAEAIVLLQEVRKWRPKGVCDEDGVWHQADPYNPAPLAADHMARDERMKKAMEAISCYEPQHGVFSKALGDMKRIARQALACKEGEWLDLL